MKLRIIILDKCGHKYGYLITCKYLKKHDLQKFGKNLNNFLHYIKINILIYIHL